ncbi:MAG: hypothetical protein Q8O84_03450 [Nanoarchaeota archaeon]|nr:hypothetical protein [Nanoarchaeota archaeon]
MKTKEIIIIFTAFLLIVIFSFLASAEQLGCAEKTNTGAWCQQVPESEKATGLFSWTPTSCSQTGYCKTGTCVNENTGGCTSNTPKTICENTGGKWEDKDKNEISECKPGCCILGQEVAFVNEPACQQLATDYSVDVDFREDINSQSQCFTLDTTPEEGACILEKAITSESAPSGFFENLFGGESSTPETSVKIDCVRTTQSGCSSLNGDFRKGLLCSAQGLSDCAKSKETKIVDDKVYFKDTCENKANIYDSSMFANTNYWEEIQDPKCSVGSTPSSTCGDCSYRLGTIGAEYKSGDDGMPTTSPKYGNNVCRELSCFYDTNNDGDVDKINEKYKHGESWCAESEGTYPHVPYKLDDAKKDELREGYNDYNLPGSRYYKLKCYDGETIVEPCKEYRNSICKETTDSANKRVAACFANEDVTCLAFKTKSSCEKVVDKRESGCKWVPGYNLEGTVVGDGELNGTKLEEYNEKQGICYPIFTPGTTFWNQNGEDLCAKTSGITERVLFETGILIDKDKFAEDGKKEAANKCIDGCYAIPGYGSSDGTNYEDVETLKNFQLGDGKLDEKVQNAYFSKREGYYCKKKVDEPDSIDNSKTGKEKGNTIDCDDTGDGKDSERRRVKPFYTHEQWLKTIREMTRSIGDCGYKPSAFYKDIITEKGKETGTGWLGDPNSEIITVIFQKLKQSKEVKETVGEKITLYKGDETTPNSEYRGEIK